MLKVTKIRAIFFYSNVGATIQTQQSKATPLSDQNNSEVVKLVNSFSRPRLANLLIRDFGEDVKAIWSFYLNCNFLDLIYTSTMMSMKGNSAIYPIL